MLPRLAVGVRVVGHAQVGVHRRIADVVVALKKRPIELSERTNQEVPNHF